MKPCRRIGWHCLAFWAACFTLISTAQAEPLPIHEDACLHDVQFVGGKIGWAVGDHGAIWHTTDGGQRWHFVPAPVDCPLRGVCFLTDRVGWIVGGGTTPHTRLGYGVVLFTNDAGQSWQVLAKETVPPLHYVKFFGLEEGVIVGEATQEHPTGILGTIDGGKTWQPLPGEKSSGWRTADFLEPGVGAVAGSQGRVKLVGGGRLLAAQVGTFGLRNVRAIQLKSDHTGWLAGDGGLILQTENGGVSWEPPTARLPRETAETIDFHAIAVKGSHVWLAGSPGSVIWHSAAAGHSWRKLLTGQTLPISALSFTSETTGWAVGAMGVMLWTGDGGETWRTVRGANRRAALLAIPARPARVPFALLTKLGGDEGYRSVVFLPARRDVGPDAAEFAQLDQTLAEAVTVAGGSTAEINWRLPIGTPGLERNAERLQADWNARTEQRLDSVFLEDLVRRLRTWRPDVIILDAVAPDDALTSFLHDALNRAVVDAADPTRHLALQEQAGLAPWQVRKIYLRLPPGSVGDAHVDPHEYLPRRKTSLQNAAASAWSRLLELDHPLTERQAYRAVFNQTQPESSPLQAGDFFAGLTILPDSDARRALLPIDPQEDADRRAVIARQRNFQAYAERMLEDPRHAAQVIGQLREVTAGMTDQEAALQLAQLGEGYRRLSRWDLVESTLVELVERYPDEPATHEAMRWLFQLWTAAEPAWQRSRKVQVTRGQVQANVHEIQNRINQALARATQPQLQLTSTPQPETGPDPVRFVTQAGGLQITKEQDWRTGSAANWQQQAVQMATLIRQKSPSLFLTPGIQFPLAALMRQRGVYRLSDSYYRRFQRLGEGDAWKIAADAELWLANSLAQPPKPILHCQPTSRRPHLDGVLSDPCWQAAKVLPLNNPKNLGTSPAALNRDETAFMMLCYDREFLYLAASISRVEHVTNEAVQLSGRKHDADLNGRDRLAIAIDVDRDYATWYTLEVDQRGWTRDQCWDDAGWNPKWFVAAEADEKRWRIEAAIPFSELAPQTPSPGTTWALGIVRIMPAVGVQGWPEAHGSTPHPEAFGLVRFD